MMMIPFLRISRTLRTTFKSQSSSHSTVTTGSQKTYRENRPNTSATFALVNLHRHLVNHVNHALGITVNFLQSICSDTQIVSEESHSSYHIQSLMSPSPKLKVEYKLIMHPRYVAARKKRAAENRARVFGGRYVQEYETDWKKRKEAPAPAKHIIPENLAPIRNVSLLMSYGKKTRKLRETQARTRDEKRKSQEKERYKRFRMEKDREFEESCRGILNRPDPVVGRVFSEPFCDKEEAERRQKNWMKYMPRTADGKLYAFGCGNRYVEWRSKWERRKTPPVLGHKRKRELTIMDYIQQPRPKRKRTHYQRVADQWDIELLG